MEWNELRWIILTLVIITIIIFIALILGLASENPDGLEWTVFDEASWHGEEGYWAPLIDLEALGEAADYIAFLIGLGIILAITFIAFYVIKKEEN